MLFGNIVGNTMQQKVLHFLFAVFVVRVAWQAILEHAVPQKTEQLFIYVVPVTTRGRSDIMKPGVLKAYSKPVQKRDVKSLRKQYKQAT